MPIPRPEDQIWIAFNALPGGQIMAMHFENINRKKKVGDTIQDVSITSKDQMVGFEKSPQVALYVEGKLVKNKVLIYDGPDAMNLWKNPRAASVVIEWAKKKGLMPIPTKDDQKGDNPKTYEYNKRIETLEGRMDEQDKKLDKILEAVGKK